MSTNISKNFGVKSKVILWLSSWESELGNTDNFQLSLELTIPLDLIKLENLDTKPNKDLLSTELESEEEVERDQCTEVSFAESPPQSVSTNLNQQEILDLKPKKELVQLLAD